MSCLVGVAEGLVIVSPWNRQNNQNDLKMYFPDHVTVGLKPLDRLRHPVAQAVTCFKAEELLGPTDVQTTPWLAVRLCGIPLNCSGEPHFCRNQGR